MRKITPFLWFQANVEEAFAFYRSIFPGARITNPIKGPDGRLQGATFELEGQEFIGFNGGPDLKLNPAVSMYVNCESQAEVDELWRKLTDGGSESHCGWLVDRYGLSWQIIPSALPRLLGDPDRGRATRALNAMLKMQKIDIATLERAAAGELSA